MDSTHINKSVDVIVIGGGPGGTTAASLLARRGHSVALFEKSQHPRFHIGESLLPMNLPILDRLGVHDAVKAIAVKKLGADFNLGAIGQDYQVCHFSMAGGDIPHYAYQVERATFDHILFEQSRKDGVKCFENHCVEAVDLTCAPVNVHVRNASGECTQWQAKMVVDASGRDTFLAAKQGWKKANPKHASAAMFAHMAGIGRRPGEEEGNISIYAFEHGWVWMIPLPNGVFSVGITCTPSYLKRRSSSLQAFFLETLASIPLAQERLKNVQLIGEVRAAANYSYHSKKTWGNNFVSIGDAAVFVDPVFSSGVFMAMHNGESVVPIIEQNLKGNEREYRRLCKKYVQQNDKALRIFSWFIYRFNTPAMRYLFQNPRNVFGVQSAVISMLAGDVFGASKIGRKLWLFRLIYNIARLFHWPIWRQLGWVDARLSGVQSAAVGKPNLHRSE